MTLTCCLARLAVPNKVASEGITLLADGTSNKRAIFYFYFFVKSNHIARLGEECGAQCLAAYTADYKRVIGFNSQDVTANTTQRNGSF